MIPFPSPKFTECHRMCARQMGIYPIIYVASRTGWPDRTRSSEIHSDTSTTDLLDGPFGRKQRSCDAPLDRDQWFSWAASLHPTWWTDWVTEHPGRHDKQADWDSSGLIWARCWEVNVLHWPCSCICAADSICRWDIWLKDLGAVDQVEFPPFCLQSERQRSSS